MIHSSCALDNIYFAVVKFIDNKKIEVPRGRKNHVWPKAINVDIEFEHPSTGFQEPCNILDVLCRIEDVVQRAAADYKVHCVRQPIRDRGAQVANDARPFISADIDCPDFLYTEHPEKRPIVDQLQPALLPESSRLGRRHVDLDGHIRRLDTTSIENGTGELEIE